MEFHFNRAAQILWETFPFVLLRLLVYGLAIALAILWWGGLFYLFLNWPFPGPPWLAFVFGGILFGGGAKLVREYVLYLVKAAHVAVITRLALEGQLPAGQGQISYGRDLVLGNFLRVSILFGVDRLVHLVVRAFNRSVFGLLKAMPGIKAFENFSRRALDYSAGYVDEAILSYSLLFPQRNPWESAREGLVLYVQNWKTILGSGVILAMISYVVVGVVAAPGALFAWLAGGPLFQAWIAVSFGLGLLVKFALMDPFALTSVIVNYHKAIEGQRPDPTWEAHLAQVAPRFAEFERKASEWSPGSTPPPAPGVKPITL